MLNLKGEQVYLRALEPTDLDFLYKLENDTSVWEVSGTLKPYSKKYYNCIWTMPIGIFMM